MDLRTVSREGYIGAPGCARLLQRAKFLTINANFEAITANQIGSVSADKDFEPEVAVTRIIELIKTRIPRRFGLDPVRDIQVLCPMNRGGIGARALPSGVANP